jgi:hypothetical protein
MDKYTYEEIEKFVYENLMNNGENDVYKVKIEITVEGEHTETFEYVWNKKKDSKDDN